MLKHRIAQMYGLNPIDLGDEDADAWLTHLAILHEAGVIGGKGDG